MKNTYFFQMNIHVTSCERVVNCKYIEEVPKERIETFAGGGGGEEGRRGVLFPKKKIIYTKKGGL